MLRQYHADCSMDEVMRHWPQTIRVILDHGLLCVGCPIASFHTVEDAIREHGLAGKAFRQALREAIDATQGRSNVTAAFNVPPRGASVGAAASPSPADGRS